jgi:hypothetical protein
VDRLNRRRTARAGWRRMLEERGFVEVQAGSPMDTFAGAQGEAKARTYEVYGYTFLARKPG